MASYTIEINGTRHRIEADAAMPLLWVLRDRLNLTGTKFGCGAGVCGACTVHEDGRAVQSCQVTVAKAAGKSYTTIEGLAAGDTHPCQRAWLDEDVAQCGFCQPGMIMAAAALVRTNATPSDADIDRAIGGHICRCGTYTRIRAAVLRAARQVRA
jgi:aerobic-type carbon monoxide dehydrogenase small subunit (CoxS/CutS family)